MDIKIYLDKQTKITPRRSKKGWNSGTILSMLRKETYIGKQVWEWKEELPNKEINIIERIEIKIPRIIDDKLWKEVQKKINDNFPITLDGTSRKSLLKGLLVCKNCKLQLGHRFKNVNHYYGRCSEVNWRRVDNKIDKKNCPLKKSPRMDQLDEKVVNIVTDVLKNSKTIREDYKVKNLQSKFEDKETIRKISDTLKRNLREKQLERSKVDDEIINLEYDIRLGKITKSQSEKLKERFKDHSKTIEEEIETLNTKLSTISNSKGWVNWLEKINEELDKMENLTFERKRDFLNDIVDKIIIEYDNKKKSHILDINFKLPIVGDNIIYSGNLTKQGLKEYKIEDGVNHLNTSIILDTSKINKNTPKKQQLISRVIELKEKDGYSLNHICEILNKEKLLPPNGGSWYKSKLSSFYNYIKETTPK